MSIWKRIFVSRFTCNGSLKKGRVSTLQQFISITKDYQVINYQHIFTTACDLLKLQPSMNKPLTQSVIKQHNYGNITFWNFNAFLWSFMMRLQPHMKSKIDDVVRSTLHKYDWTASSKTISLPIRGSDKCWSNRRHGEMKCSTMEQNVNAIRKLQTRFGADIDTVIVSSEDQSVLLQYQNLSLSMKDIKFVFNDFDVFPNTGNPIDLKKNTSRFQDDTALFHLFVAMMSTFKLQMHAKYYILNFKSNWIHGIWIVSDGIHCELEPSPMDDDQRHCINFDRQGHEAEIDEFCYRDKRFKWTELHKELRDTLVSD